jgi:3-phosphoglycerate kinase
MPSFRTLDGADVKGKRVLVRVDFNVPVENGTVADSTRIKRAAPTILDIAGRGGKVILMSHFGRPKGRDLTDSLKPLVPAIAAVLGRPVAFAEDCIGEKALSAVNAMRPGDVLCLENTRFHDGEERNDPRFCRTACGARRHLRQRCLLVVAPRPCLGGRIGPQAAGLCRARLGGGSRCADQSSGNAGSLSMPA